MAENRTAKLGFGARILQGAVLAGLAVMTAAAAWQTWKQVTLPDFRTSNQKTPETDPLPPVDWAMLRGLDLKSGQASEALKRFDGKRVRIPGFVVPLEDKQNKVSEFLLVPYVGACIHTPPPPANQIVQVRTMDRNPVNVTLTDPVWVIGELKIATVKSQYGDVAFQVKAQAVEPYQEKP